MELAVIEAARDQGWDSAGEPLELNAIFYMPRPKAHFRANGELKANAPLYCPTKPDLDNIVKSCADALETSGVVARDQLIVALHVVKLYGREEDTGASLTLSKAISDTKVDNHG